MTAEGEVVARAIEGGAADEILAREESGTIFDWWPGYARDMNAWASNLLGRAFTIFDEDHAVSVIESVEEISVAINKRLEAMRWWTSP